LHIHHHSNIHIRPFLQFGPSQINNSNDHTKKRRKETDHTHDVSAIDISYAHDIMSTKRTQDISEDGIDVLSDISAKQKHKQDTSGDGITDGETITAILRGDVDFNQSFNTTTSEIQHRLRFQPGQINLTQAEVLRYCYANPEIYARHFPSSDRQVTSISDKYKIVYLLLPKGGSSTGRWIMEHALDGHNAPLHPAGNDLHKRYGDYTVLTFVREPLQRFYSQYDEAFIRYAPWVKGREFFIHPYAFIYENMTSQIDYQNVFCPPDLLPSHIRERTVRGINHWCTVKQQTKENGTLAMRFEQFVERYNGLEPYDIHLHLQVPHISNKYTGRPRRVDEIYSTDANNTIKNWESIVTWYGKSLPEDGVYNARSKPRRFKTSLVSTRTKQKICRISAIDYCCLNIELPTECKDIGIHCSLQNKDGDLQIQPWQHPHEID